MKATGQDYQAQPPAVQGGGARESRGGGGLKDLVNSEYVKRRFTEVMGEKSAAFLASVLNAIRVNPMLQKADPNSVLSSAMVAATLDLPIDSSLGFAAIVPYKTKGRLVAQFQIMTKGFVQLALRSGQYKTINVSPIYEDEYKGYDIISGDVHIEPVEDGYRSHDMQDKIVGYAAFFRLLNGFERIEFWPLKRIVAHGKRFSKSFGNEYGLWNTDPHAMYAKTVLKNMLSRWGILSVNMQMAMKTDQAAIRDFDKPLDDDGNVEYVDSTDAEDVKAEEAQEDKGAKALSAAQGAEPAPAPVAPEKKESAPVAAPSAAPAKATPASPGARGDEEPIEEPEDGGLF